MTSLFTTTQHIYVIIHCTPHQPDQATSINIETSHRLIQWFNIQAKYNHKNDKDIRALDTAVEKTGDEVKEIRKELKRKRKDIEDVKEKQTTADDVIAKLVATIAVLEGQVNQQREMINHQQVLIDHMQTIAT